MSLVVKLFYNQLEDFNLFYARDNFYFYIVKFKIFTASKEYLQQIKPNFIILQVL